MKSAGCVITLILSVCNAVFLTSFVLRHEGSLSANDPLKGHQFPIPPVGDPARRERSRLSDAVDDIGIPGVTRTSDTVKDIPILRVGRLEATDIVLRDTANGKAVARLATFGDAPLLFFFDGEWNWRMRLGILNGEPAFETR